MSTLTVVIKNLQDPRQNICLLTRPPHVQRMLRTLRDCGRNNNNINNNNKNNDSNILLRSAESGMFNSKSSQDQNTKTLARSASMRANLFPSARSHCSLYLYVKIIVSRGANLGKTGVRLHVQNHVIECGRRRRIRHFVFATTMTSAYYFPLIYLRTYIFFFFSFSRARERSILHKRLTHWPRSLPSSSSSWSRLCQF